MYLYIYINVINKKIRKLYVNMFFGKSLKTRSDTNPSKHYN